MVLLFSVLLWSIFVYWINSEECNEYFGPRSLLHKCNHRAIIVSFFFLHHLRIPVRLIVRIHFVCLYPRLAFLWRILALVTLPRSSRNPDDAMHPEKRRGINILIHSASYQEGHQVQNCSCSHLRNDRFHSVIICEKCSYVVSDGLVTHPATRVTSCTGSPDVTTPGFFFG